MSEKGVCKNVAFVDQQVLDLLTQATSMGCDAAEIDVTMESGFSVSVRKGSLDLLEQQNEQGLSLTVFKEQCAASVSTTDFTEKSLQAVLLKAMSLVSFTQPDEFKGLADRSCLAFDYPDLQLNHPRSVTPDEAIVLAMEMDARVCEEDSRILHCESAEVSTSLVNCLYANTHGFVGHYPYSVHQMSCGVLAEDQTGKQQDADYDVHCSFESLCDVKLLAEKAAKKTCRRLSPRKIKTQQCPVIFLAPVARGLMGTFLRAINGHNIYRESSFLRGAIGELVFPPFFSLTQQPHEKRVLHSAPFDNEGVVTREMELVSEGRFHQYLCDSYAARRLGCQTTGNAGGAHNVYVGVSDFSLPDLLAQMHQGLLITDLMGQGINIIYGDYSRGASGFWIDNGEIQFPVDEVTVAGNLREMYANIAAVSNDVDRRGNIKTGSILIGNMTVAGE